MAATNKEFGEYISDPLNTLDTLGLGCLLVTYVERLQADVGDIDSLMMYLHFFGLL